MKTYCDHHRRNWYDGFWIWKKKMVWNFQLVPPCFHFYCTKPSLFTLSLSLPIKENCKIAVFRELVICILGVQTKVKMEVGPIFWRLGLYTYEEMGPRHGLCFIIMYRIDLTIFTMNNLFTFTKVLFQVLFPSLLVSNRLVRKLIWYFSKCFPYL